MSIPRAVLPGAVFALASAAAAATPTPPHAPPEPSGKVTYIGMHIGGGPNDAATKAPFERAIWEHVEAFRSCYGAIVATGAKGTFGIDLLIPAAGGHPETSNVRTAIRDEAFRECLGNAFESVEFGKPKRGATKLSYSLRFEPE